MFENALGLNEKMFCWWIAVSILLNRFDYALRLFFAVNSCRIFIEVFASLEHILVHIIAIILSFGDSILLLLLDRKLLLLGSLRNEVILVSNVRLRKLLRAHGFEVFFEVLVLQKVQRIGVFNVNQFLVVHHSTRVGILVAGADRNIVQASHRKVIINYCDVHQLLTVSGSLHFFWIILVSAFYVPHRKVLFHYVRTIVSEPISDRILPQIVLISSKLKVIWVISVSSLQVVDIKVEVFENSGQIIAGWVLPSLTGDQFFAELFFALTKLFFVEIKPQNVWFYRWRDAFFCDILYFYFLEPRVA